MKDLLLARKNDTKHPDLNLFQKHTHEHYEIFCFLTGDAKYFIEGTIYDLRPNDLLIIKKSEVHALLINQSLPYSRYVVHFEETDLLQPQGEDLIKLINQKPLGKANRITAGEGQTEIWLHYLDQMVHSKSYQEQRAYLTILLAELCKNLNLEEEGDYFVTETEKLIQYINQNLLKILTLEEICQEFGMSKTHLNRKFKAITGTTLWDYIVTKRLILAKDLLNDGYRPNLVSEKCGWMEYSSFYRAYKQQFGVTPKEDYRHPTRPPREVL